MKKKLFFSVVLLFTVVAVFGQYSEKWTVSTASDDYNFIGCENMDNDNNKEIVLFSVDYSHSPYYTFYIIDGLTGNLEYSLGCNWVSFGEYSSADYNPSCTPRLVDVNNDGKYELLFFAEILYGEEEKVHLISFSGASNSSQLISNNNSIKIENYPNPFNKSTTIKYNVPSPSNVIIKLFDINGNEIQTILNEQKNKGTYELSFDSKSLQSGTYFYQVQMDNFKDAKKMIIIK